MNKEFYIHFACICKMSIFPSKSIHQHHRDFSHILFSRNLVSSISCLFLVLCTFEHDLICKYCKFDAIDLFIYFLPSFLMLPLSSTLPSYVEILPFFSFSLLLLVL